MIALAGGQLLWELVGTEHLPSTDPLLRSGPAFEFDQRIAW